MTIKAGVYRGDKTFSVGEIQGAFEALTTNPNSMKSMIRISGDAS